MRVELICLSWCCFFQSSAEKPHGITPDILSIIIYPLFNLIQSFVSIGISEHA